MLVLVGELNPHGLDPRYALFDLPKHASGARLRRIMGLDRGSYLQLRRVNLCVGAWSLSIARDRARALKAEMGPDDVAVLLGRKVASAFGRPEAAFTRVGPFLLLPHPSGRCLAWNDPLAIESARSMLRAADPTTPFGEFTDGKRLDRGDQAPRIAGHLLRPAD